MTKKELRQLYRSKRALLDLQQQHSLMAGMLRHAEPLLSLKPNTVLGYRHDANRQEVPADMLLEWWQNNSDNFAIAEPRVFENQMDGILVNDDTAYTQSSFGISEPANGAIIDPQDIDVVVIPLLAYDTRGFRVGYGKGFYDKYLKACRPNVLKIGLSWFAPEEQIEDIQPHDVPLTHCLTPNQLYVF